jgi:hypothetical protein
MMVAKDRRDRIHCKTGFFVILKEVKDRRLGGI